MLHRLSFKIRRESAADEVVNAEFSDDEWNRLATYAKEADRLLESADAQPRLNVAIQLKFVIGPPAEIRYAGEQLSDDTVAVLLHRMRPFILQSDGATYFHNVVKLLKWRIASDHLRAHLSALGEQFDGSAFQAQLKISAGALVVNSEKQLCAWLNSEEFHRDPDKASALKALRAGLPMPAEPVFQYLLLEKMRAILNVAHLIRAMELREGQEIASTPFG